MNQPIQQCNSTSPTNIPMKRKRGRPRKDETIAAQMENRHYPPLIPIAYPPNRYNHNIMIAPSPAPPPPPPPYPLVMGQVFTGVIDGAFESGYLIKVRVANTNTFLKGVVFKPGQIEPVTQANDVAPFVRMYHRHEFPHPGLNPPPQPQTPASVMSVGPMPNASFSIPVPPPREKNQEPPITAQSEHDKMMSEFEASTGITTELLPPATQSKPSVIEASEFLPRTESIKKLDQLVNFDGNSNDNGEKQVKSPVLLKSVTLSSGSNMEIEDLPEKNVEVESGNQINLLGDSVNVNGKSTKSLTTVTENFNLFEVQVMVSHPEPVAAIAAPMTDLQSTLLEEQVILSEPIPAATTTVGIPLSTPTMGLHSNLLEEQVMVSKPENAVTITMEKSPRQHLQANLMILKPENAASITMETSPKHDLQTNSLEEQVMISNTENAANTTMEKSPKRYLQANSLEEQVMISIPENAATITMEKSPKHDLQGNLLEEVISKSENVATITMENSPKHDLQANFLAGQVMVSNSQDAGPITEEKSLSEPVMDFHCNLPEGQGMISEPEHAASAAASTESFPKCQVFSPSAATNNVDCEMKDATVTVEQSSSFSMMSNFPTEV